MATPVEIENIEQLRRDKGIDDVELRAAVRRLRAGDLVNLTFLPEVPRARSETLCVRITRVRKTGFLGELTDRPASVHLAGLRVGLAVRFTSEHIHSIPRQVCRPDQPRQMSGSRPARAAGGTKREERGCGERYRRKQASAGGGVKINGPAGSPFPAGGSECSGPSF
jgi:hypothetical protein